jgi:hypothetical protein
MGLEINFFSAVIDFTKQRILITRFKSGFTSQKHCFTSRKQYVLQVKNTMFYKSKT